MVCAEEWMRGVCSELSQADSDRFLMLCWTIWKCRNSLLMEGKAQHPLQVVNFADRSLHEFTIITRRVGNSQSQQQAEQQWQPPLWILSKSTSTVPCFLLRMPWELGSLLGMEKALSWLGELDFLLMQPTLPLLNHWQLVQRWNWPNRKVGTKLYWKEIVRLLLTDYTLMTRMTLLVALLFTTSEASCEPFLPVWPFLFHESVTLLRILFARKAAFYLDGWASIPHDLM
ncbi:hypothetical protein Salat_1862800 [Sesamum alatum]|uniref:Uncharacterized protein n=1 Tax=Sesamum alatum TaxID=300844 RepID=A0AAE1Y4A1_9LAMI|nr:hypothetical protein Salat_1862800 [Sesamum alatum]